MLNTALSVVECMTKECSTARNAFSEQATTACLRDLEFAYSLMKSLLNRSAALEKRMENEISLVSIPVQVPLTGFSQILANGTVGFPQEFTIRHFYREPDRVDLSARWPDHQRDQCTRHVVPARHIHKRKCSVRHNNPGLH